MTNDDGHISELTVSPLEPVHISIEQAPPASVGTPRARRRARIRAVTESYGAPEAGGRRHREVGTNRRTRVFLDDAARERGLVSARESDFVAHAPSERPLRCSPVPR